MRLPLPILAVAVAMLSPPAEACHVSRGIHMGAVLLDGEAVPAEFWFGVRDRFDWPCPGDFTATVVLRPPYGVPAADAIPARLDRQLQVPPTAQCLWATCSDPLAEALFTVTAHEGPEVLRLEGVSSAVLAHQSAMVLQGSYRGHDAAFVTVTP